MRARTCSSGSSNTAIGWSERIRPASGSHTQATTGGHLGGGIDFHASRSFSIGVNGGYNWMVDFSQPVGVRDNYSGPEIGFTLGFLFGQGRHP